MVCEVLDDCPRHYTRSELVTIAKECGVRITRDPPLKGQKTMAELCENIRAIGPPPPPENCVISTGCPKGLTRSRLLQIAKDCRVAIHRKAPQKGQKNMAELCDAIKQVAVIRDDNDGFTDTNETFGQTIEYMLCDLAGIPADVSEARINREIAADPPLRAMLQIAMNALPAPLARHSAARQSEVDFVLQNSNTLSVKTTINNQSKVCPQVIGQMTVRRFLERFGYLINFSLTNADADASQIRNVKQILLRHVGFMLNQYLKYTVSCDFLLWLHYTDKNKFAMIVKKSDIHRKFFDVNKIRFSRPTIEDWNESNTVYYDDVSIGEFQIHTKRSAVKFRFSMANLLNVLSNKKKVFTFAFDPRENEIKKKMPSADGPKVDKNPNKQLRIKSI